jgi:predicted ester cyclase
MTPSEIVTAFVQHVWNDGEVDRIPAFISPEYRVEDVVVGQDWVRNNVATFRNAFSDLRLTIERMVEQENAVAVMVRLDGRHTGIIKGFAPTGRTVSYREVAFWDVDPATGLIVAGEFVADTLMPRIQMGIVPAEIWHGPLE